jgi:hypothetical protein
VSPPQPGPRRQTPPRGSWPGICAGHVPSGQHCRDNAAAVQPPAPAPAAVAVGHRRHRPSRRSWASREWPRPRRQQVQGQGLLAGGVRAERGPGQRAGPRLGRRYPPRLRERPVPGGVGGPAEERGVLRRIRQVGGRRGGYSTGCSPRTEPVLPERDGQVQDSQLEPGHGGVQLGELDHQAGAVIVGGVAQHRGGGLRGVLAGFFQRAPGPRTGGSGLSEAGLR